MVNIYVVIIFSALIAVLSIFPFVWAILRLKRPFTNVSRAGYSTKRTMITDETYFFANKKFAQAIIYAAIFDLPVAGGCIFLLFITRSYIPFIVACGLLFITIVVIHVYLELSLRKFIQSRYGIFTKKAARE